jgi:hypothetical protein
LKIEYLRAACSGSFNKKIEKDGAKRHPQIFNIQSSIINISRLVLGRRKKLKDSL